MLHERIHIPLPIPRQAASSAMAREASMGPVNPFPSPFLLRFCFLDDIDELAVKIACLCVAIRYKYSSTLASDLPAPY